VLQALFAFLAAKGMKKLSSSMLLFQFSHNPAEGERRASVSKGAMQALAKGSCKR
jgi:hypothetical protein